MVDAGKHALSQTGLTEDIAFLDNRSATAIAWPDVWAQVQPSSVYGKRLKSRVKPFKPGQELGCHEVLQQLEADIEGTSTPLLHQLQQSLQTLPDITEAIDALSVPGRTLSQKEILALKGLAYSGIELCQCAQRLRWSGLSPWQSLLSLFGNSQTRSFSVHDVAGDVYREAASDCAKAQGAVAQATRLLDSGWMDETNIRPNREGLLVLPLPTHRAVAEDCKSRTGLRWLRDTPFESVFEVLPTPEMEALFRKVLACQASLDAVEQAVLKQLSDELRSHALTWKACVNDVAMLDWRLAKVAIARRWHATVPQLANRMALQEGVHPLIAERLAKQDRSFVPLTFAPQDGVNVLCGSNMGGKTVAMTLLSLCQVLTQYGLPVPARAFETKLVMCVRFCESAQTDTGNGLSSFGTEVTRMVAAWRDMLQVESGLVCFDEPGRSTNPTEGEALVIGLIRAIGALSPKRMTWIATHFASPIQEEQVAKFRVRGLRTSLLERAGPPPTGDQMNVRLHELEQAMDYRIESFDGADVALEGIRIAQWLGVPEGILAESRQYLQRGKRL